MKTIFATLVLFALTASTCTKLTYAALLTGRWTLYDQKGGFRIQPHPLPVVALQFSGGMYRKFVDGREIESGTWTISGETLSGDTLRAAIRFANASGDENHKIRAIGKSAFVLDEDAPAYDGVAWYYKRE